MSSPRPDKTIDGRNNTVQPNSAASHLPTEPIHNGKVAGHINGVAIESFIDSYRSSLDETPKPEPKIDGPSSEAYIPSTSSQTYNASLCGDKLEPIAVIGLSLRFPQDAISSESFWQMLIEGRSAMSDIPKDRFNVDSFYRLGKTKTGALNAKGGHFIKEDIATFDAPFFIMTPSEAECVDPLQRWLLETVYEGLENGKFQTAGIPIEAIAGSKTSVHIGAFLREYDILLSRDPQIQQKYKASGNAFAMLANRVSWFFDLMGPSISIDTACSSSLCALHLACQNLRSGDSTMGIVGGCNLFYNPDSMADLSDLNFLSPDSICYSFDHRANGYSRGEGFGVVILKTLTAALKDGDTIRGVIRATGANQDGRTPGITQPSSHAQEQLIRNTYAAGGLDMSLTRYFEAHGTGTPTGDPIEASAIHAAFKEVQRPDSPLLIGAVKSNIGHLEGGAGIAGLIKTILVLEKGIVPPNIWFERANPKIPTEEWNIKFPVRPTPWPVDGLRRASVNSFGFGGSNAHVVLDDAFNYLKTRGISGRHCTRELLPKKNALISQLHREPRALTQPAEAVAKVNPKLGISQLFVWSAAEESAIDRLSTGYSKYVEDTVSNCTGSALFQDLAYTLSEKRSRLPWKAFAVASSVSELQSCLEQGLSTPVRSGRAPKLGYLFTGQGAQWYAMGRELIEYSVFRSSLEGAELAFRSWDCPWSLLDELKKDEAASRLLEPALSQPVCTAVQIALVELLGSWNVFPTIVVGHSSGEIAAAYCAGGLSRNSAWKVAYYRGLVGESLKTTSGEAMAMLSVGLSESDMQNYLHQHRLEGDKVTIACINSIKNVTISGSLEAIDLLNGILQKDDIFARKLKVAVAYHSKYMNNVTAAYEAFIDDIQPGIPAISQPVMYSSVTGQLVSIAELGHSSYWIRNMVLPVKFSQAISNICSDDAPQTLNGSRVGNDGAQVDHIVEIGPHSALQGPFKENLKTTQRGKTIGYSSILVRHKSAASTALQVAGTLYSLGYVIDITRVNSRGLDVEGTQMLTTLPTYPFNHSKKYWLESRLSKNFRFRTQPHNELLGSMVPDWNPLDARWRNFITLEDHPWVEGHKVNGTNVYPASGMIVMAIEAVRQLADPKRHISGYQFKNVSVKSAIVLRSSDTKIETEFHLRSNGEDRSQFLAWSDFKLFTYENDSSLEACSGLVALQYEYNHKVDLSNADGEPQEISKIHEAASQRCSRLVASKKVYEHFGQTGLDYGPPFQTLRNIRFGDVGEATAQIDLHEWRSGVTDMDIQPHFIHPVAFDAVLQLSIAALTNGGNITIPTMVPTKFLELWFSTDASDITPLSDRQARSEDILHVYAKSAMCGPQNCEISITAIDARSRKPRIVCSLEATSVGQSEKRTTIGTVSTPFGYNIEWKPDLDLMKNQDMVRYCSSQIDYLVFPPESAIKLSEKQLYCTIILWQANQIPQLDHLSVDTLQLLFQDNAMNDYYRQVNDAYPTFSKLKVYINALAHKKPDMKILEIGAGTGSATMDVLDALTQHDNNETKLARFSQYVFTDISPKFLKDAKETFKEKAELLTFSVLDIGKDPIRQGFEEGKYDVIIASNVLHATPNLGESLFCTSLLTPMQSGRGSFLASCRAGG